MTRIIFAAFAFVVFARAEVKNGSKEAAAPGAQISVDESDIKILHRADQILASEDWWNRKDSRDCPIPARTYSLYCALFKASVDINGEFDHRLGAIEEVRRTVESLSKKKYDHRLMDFNNDPSTSFAKVKEALSVTEKRLRARVKK